MVKKKLQIDEERFLKGQFAAQMGGDIRNALIELITNADDAYERNGVTGPIRVEISEYRKEDFETHQANEVVAVYSVFDKAGGIPPAEVHDKMFKYGAGTSGLAAGDAIGRGIHGQGAKDTNTFGYFSLQSVSSDGYFEFSLSGTDIDEPDEGGRDVHQSDRERLGLNNNEHGIRASVLVTRENEHLLPPFAGLVNSLRNDAQLRAIIDDRDVSVFDSRGKANSPTILENLTVPETTEYENTFELEGFPNPVTLRLFKLDVEQSGIPSPNSIHGLWVHSGRVGYQNSWFGFQSQPGHEWLRGELELVDAPFVIRQDIESPNATGRLVKPNRSGLNEKHPYFQKALEAVTTALYEAMAKVVAEKQSKRAESPKMRRANAIAAEVIGRILKQHAERLDENPQGLGSNGELSEFDIIPPMKRVAPGTSSTISLRVEPSLAKANLSVQLLGESGSAEIQGAFGQKIDIDWAEHPRRDRLLGQWKFQAGMQEGSAKVQFSLADEIKTATILVTEHSEEDEVEPESLGFEKSKYQVSPGRGKWLTVIGPLSLAGAELSIWSEGLSSEIKQMHEMVISSAGNRSEAHFRLEAGMAEEEGLICAEIERTGTFAQVPLIVKIDSSTKGFQPRFVLDREKSPRRRSVLKKAPDGVLTSYVFPNHSSFNGTFGEYDEKSERFANESADDVRSTIAITHAERIASHMLLMEGARNPDWDVNKHVQVFEAHLQDLAEVLGKVFLDPENR